MKDIETIISTIGIDNLDKLLSYVKYCDNVGTIMDSVELHDKALIDTLNFGDVCMYKIYHHFVKNLLIYI